MDVQSRGDATEWSCAPSTVPVETVRGKIHVNDFSYIYELLYINQNGSLICVQVSTARELENEERKSNH